jgi:phosphoserine phosphatase
VVIVSGGLLPPVTRLATHLGIEEVYAVGIHFHRDGSYAGFEETSPLARAGGKPEILRTLGDPADPTSAGAIVLVGDGTTDLEAAPFVARFVAFGGIERREAVFKNARVTCEVADFRALVPHLISPREIETLRSRPEHRRLLK